MVFKNQLQLKMLYRIHVNIWIQIFIIIKSILFALTADIIIRHMYLRHFIV